MIILAISNCLVYDYTKKIEEVVKNGKPLLVKFMAPWCMECKLMDEEYDRLSEAINTKIARVSQVNCITQEKFCVQMGVKKFPHVILFNAKDSKEPVTYSGQYKVYDMKKWLLGHWENAEL